MSKYIIFIISFVFFLHNSNQIYAAQQSYKCKESIETIEPEITPEVEELCKFIGIEESLLALVATKKNTEAIALAKAYPDILEYCNHVGQCALLVAIYQENYDLAFALAKINLRAIKSADIYEESPISLTIKKIINHSLLKEVSLCERSLKLLAFLCIKNENLNRPCLCRLTLDKELSFIDIIISNDKTCTVTFEDISTEFHYE